MGRVSILGGTRCAFISHSFLEYQILRTLRTLLLSLHLSYFPSAEAIESRGSLEHTSRDKPLSYTQPIAHLPSTPCLQPSTSDVMAVKLHHSSHRIVSFANYCETDVDLVLISIVSGGDK